jgi:hypothetical protein
MTDRTPTCCELACYEDPGCSCEGCDYRTPTTLDAAWEALHVDLTNAWQNEGPTYYENILARHRPRIETEARAEVTDDMTAAARALRERLTIDPGNVVSWGEWDTLDEALAKRYWDGKDAALEEKTP